MKIFINKFLEELAWSRSPSKLSLKKLREMYNKLVEMLNNLLRLAQRLYSKSQERLKYTKSIYEKLLDIIRKLGKHKAYKLDYKQLENYWGSFDSYKASNYPSNVNF